MYLFITILTYLIGILWVMVWAYRRSRVVPADRIPQSDWDLAARFIYVLGYLISFIGLTGFLVFGGDLAGRLMQSVAASHDLLGDVHDAFGTHIAPVAPLFAVGAILLGLKVTPLGQLDTQVLAWLHSAEHLEEEIGKVRDALIRREFKPSMEEIGKNRSKLQAHDIRLTDNDFIDSDFVSLWRKTSCLLRYAKEWEANTPGLLDAGEKDELLDIENTDTRKIEHAINIIKVLPSSQQTQQRGGPQPALPARSGATVVYSADGHGQALRTPDRALQSDTGNTYAIEMTSREFLNAIEQIQRYFVKEYDILLERICSLAAKAIVYSGHDAETRLTSLQDAGFEVGNLSRLNIDKIIKFFCLTIMVMCFSAVLFFVIGDHGGPDSTTIIKLGLAFGFSILCGAMIGSNRALARRPSTPWASIVGAGAMSFVLFFLVFFSFAVTEAIIEAAQLMADRKGPGNLSFNLGSMQIRGAEYPVTLKFLLPWTLVPVFAAIAISRLSRTNPIARGRLENGIGDGLALAGVMTLIVAVSLAFHVKMETEMLHRLYVNGVFQPITALQGIGFFAVLGFLIGYVVIPDVRKIAQTRI